MSQQVFLEDSPLRPFHFGVALSGTGGQFSDGFVLGIIGIAVSMAVGPLHLNPLWMGLLGAASLAGLFLGSMVAGPIADKYGRRAIFAYDMLLFAVVSAAQYLVTSPSQLLILRLVLGFVLGADYVVSKSLVTEYSPRRYRGRLLSMLAVAWAAGYVIAYVAGYFLRGIGPDAWRIMLAASGLPALLILPFRMIVPESPMWLMRRGRGNEALAIVKRKFGPDVTLSATTIAREKNNVWSQLFSPSWRKNTLVGCIFYSCKVIPYFALGTFAPKVLEALHVNDKFTGALVYNILLLVGSAIGLLLIDRMSRRAFLLGTFYFAAAALAVLSYFDCGPIATMLVFGLFACILSAGANLEFVYPPELFPTDLRASGVGLAVATSRLGAAISTFLLPISDQHLGIHTTLAICVAVLLFGGFFCQFMAPETGSRSLSDFKSDKSVHQSDPIEKQGPTVSSSPSGVRGNEVIHVGENKTVQRRCGP